MICKCGNTNPADFRVAKVGYRSLCVHCLSRQKAEARLKRSSWKERCTKIANRANSKSLPFDLTPEYLESLYDRQNGKCFYTDYDLQSDYGRGLSQHSLSVDRVIPALGYVKENIVLCTIQANTVKNNLTLSELRLWIPSWYWRLAVNFDLFALDHQATV